MAKIAFPNRACPKCGKPIHIRAREHDCGWKAEATAAKAKPKAMPAKTSPAKPEGSGSLSKMEAVRRVLASSGKDTMPVEIQALLRRDFNIKMDPTVISTYKSSILKKGAGKPAKLGRPKGSKNGQATVTQPKANGAAISIEDIKAVKSLAEKLGVDKLRQLAEVLA